MFKENKMESEHSIKLNHIIRWLKAEGPKTALAMFKHYNNDKAINNCNGWMKTFE